MSKRIISHRIINRYWRRIKEICLNHSGYVVTCGDAWRDKERGQFPVGTVVTYSCHTGLGGGSITCQAPGVWTQKPTCYTGTVDCGDPPEVPNAWRDRTGSGPYPFGTVVTYRCDRNNGYQGWGQATCLLHGQWSLQMPTCTGMRYEFVIK